MALSKHRLAVATMVGRDHLSRNGVLIGRPNQDACLASKSGSSTIVLVADGCGSHRSSETGASIGTRLLHTALRRLHRQHLRAYGDVPPAPAFWIRLREDVVAQLRCIALAMTDEEESFTSTVLDYLLFSLNGVLATQEHVTFFSIGDGLTVVNGEVTNLGPFPNNQPPYIGYWLIDSKFRANRELIEFKTLTIPAQGIEWVGVGTDGMDHYLTAVGRKLPGSLEQLPTISEIARDDRCFDNEDWLRRLFARANTTLMTFNRERGKVEIDHGLLPDDTTLGLIRLT